jgi:hypothetical protein
VKVVPRKLALLFRFPAWIPETYWRSFLAQPAAELMFAAHAQRATAEMRTLVAELRALIPYDLDARPDLERLWQATQRAQVREGLTAK